ncbi:pyridoxamine 5'-phosphate oxidase family protein [Nocardioides humi]|uniref:Pyridoxamine 5'-phosphate oxidase N-terminal domain-containing protein n=1 Tax=Nocardioides humi TaxID=449461 RepID=A0ABN1ZPQ8_9ACTN|nr:pyridoxamine 5'-phosphate oxidase family protein [Nocardioides humi]
MGDIVTTGHLTTIERLERAVGGRTPAGHLKSIPALDEHCVAFLRHSPLAVVGLQHRDGSQSTTLLGGTPGVLTPVAPDRLRLDWAEVPAEIAAAGDGAPVGLVALVPGYGETLRVNGRLAVTGAGADLGAEVRVEEAFLHCAKCMIRSELWAEPDLPGAGTETGTGTEAEGDLATPAVAAFLARARFVTLTTTDGAGHTDVSPKGDPAGFLAAVDARTLALPDRPGNRRTDSWHNLLEHDRIALVALTPGDLRALHVRGRARISDDEDLRARFVVQGNVPKVVLVVDVASAELRHEPALADAALWDTVHHVAKGVLPRASRIWTDHVKLNEDSGLAARVARVAVSERALRAGLAADYRRNLY